MLRLFGIDRPEKAQSDGQQATGFTTFAALGRMMEVVSYDTDHYGRMVADIVLPTGRVLNKELLKAGHALWLRDTRQGQSS